MHKWSFVFAAMFAAGLALPAYAEQGVVTFVHSGTENNCFKFEITNAEGTARYGIKFANGNPATIARQQMDALIIAGSNGKVVGFNLVSEPVSCGESLHTVRNVNIPPEAGQ